jgi:hypothetical protein
LWYQSSQNPGIIVWYVIVAAVDGGTMIFGCIRLAQYILAKGCVKSIAFVALSLNIFGLAVATLYWSIDPQGTLFALSFALVPYKSLKC